MTNTTKDGGVADMTPAELLAALDDYMTARPATDKETRVVERLAIAGGFAGEAFMRHVGCDGGAANALTRVFLVALIDPMHPDLDYLRANPEAARAARGDA